MSLPTPKLDDKDFDTLVKDAIRMIPERCPTWTDFNPSDPGITVIELMAWMTELMLYRLNRVPEKNYIKFLELMGVKLAPPRPARSWVVFELAKRAKEEALPVIEAGTRVSTKPGGAEPPVVFETTDSLNLTAAKIKALCSRVGDWVTPHSVAPLKEGMGQEEIFGGCTRVSHCLYLGSKRMEDPPEGSSILVKVEVEDQAEATRVEIEWEAWDGIVWAPLLTSEKTDEWVSALRSNGEILFQPAFKLEPYLLEGVDVVWLRARLLSAEGDAFPMLSSLQVALSLTTEYAKPPGAVFQRLRVKDDDNEIHLPVDLNAEFEPFGKVPEPNNVLYIFSVLFGRQGATCRVRFVGPQKQSGAEIEQEVVWEYFCTDEGWRDLGSDPNFQDNTHALTANGTVTFAVPKDIAQPSILGHSGYAIRARLGRSSVGAEVRGMHPAFSAIQISFTEPHSDFDAYIREDYGAFEKIVIVPGSHDQPFSALANQGPTFCLALDSLPAKRSRIYFRLEEPTVALSPRAKWEGGVNPGGDDEYFHDERQVAALPPRVKWEYWVNTEGAEDSKGKWCELLDCKDTTRGLTTSGTLDFPAPGNWQSGSPEQGVEGYWMRARRVVGELPKASVLKGLYLNATEVVEGKSHKDQPLGSSNGEPFQTVSIEAGEGRVLPGISLLVRELERPSGDEVAKLQSRLGTAFKELKDQAGDRVVCSRWHQVENFFKSGPDDCHYTFDLDQRRGIITFGDGLNGRIPPIGRDNIIAERYYVGGGVRGNVGQGTITVLEVSKDFVKGVKNVEPAQGGRDVETIEAAKLRGPWALRHRYRAVTREDFERLAKEASTEVALARCFSPEDTGAEGEAILVVIVPASDTIGARPRPNSRLIQSVRSYLDERRLLTTKLQVIGPEYDDLNIEVVPVLKTRYTGSFPEIQREIKKELKRFFDPLKGGPDGNGWPMGRTVYISELYYLLEQIKGVDHVKVDMTEHLPERDDVQGRVKRDKIKIGTRSFPYCRQITVAEG